MRNIKTKKALNLRTALLAVANLLLISYATAQDTINIDILNKIKDNPCFSAANHLAYPDPSDALMTPAPEGYAPFYLSHYGRHGSRYLIDRKDYEIPINALKKADSLSLLTPLGKDVLHKLLIIEAEAHDRYGELSPLGALQHQQIAKRMAQRFPQIFSDKASVDAKSTIVIRCILSMQNCLTTLAAIFPDLTITSDASQHDMIFMNLTDKKLFEKRNNPQTGESIENLRKSYLNYDEFTAKLIKHDYSQNTLNNLNQRDFYNRLFKVASTIQNTENRNKLSLYELYSPLDLYINWKANNMSWYSKYAAYPNIGATQPFSQRKLLRQIIHDADSIINIGAHGASLRFGHETMVLPLACLLELDSCGIQTNQLISLEDNNWICSNIFPMGANIQIIFYKSSNPDKPILIKALLNEKETTLPLQPVEGPYYKYSDFRNFFLNKLNQYENLNN